MLHSSSVVGITETWISNETMSDELLSLNGRYTPFRCDRAFSSSPGGGVCILVSSLFPSHCLFSRSFSFFCQVLGVELSYNSKAVVFCLVYRSPRCLATDFNLALDFLYSQFAHLSTPIVLMGDFNAPLVDWRSLTSSCPIGSSLLSFSQSCTFEQLIYEPTRLDNILDLVFTSTPSLISNLSVLCPPPSMDHSLISFRVSTPCPSQKARFLLDYRRANFELAQSLLSSLNWYDLLGHSADPNILYTVFCENVHHIFAQCIPVRKVLPLQSLLSPRATRLAATCQSLYRSRHSTGILKFLAASRKFRRLLNSEQRRLEKSLAQKSNLKKLYSFTRRKLKPSTSIGALRSKQAVITDPDGKAQLFANLFSSSFATSSLSPPAGPLPAPALDFIEFDTPTVSSFISKLPLRASTSPDGINYLMLKKCSSAIALPLSILFSQFMLHGKCPSIWLSAIVRPVYKNKGDRADPANYRPISLTCSSSKLMEKIVATRLNSYLARFSILSPHQHGFRSQRSCLTALLSSLTKWHLHLDRLSHISTAFIDFSCAFDSVPISLLYHKLQNVGIGGSLLRWIHSFLSCRTQRVQVDSSLSSPYDVLSGVPQGSVLGPILFTIYINDLVDSLPSEIDICLYADDVKLSAFDDPPLLQRALSSLNDWSTQWGLTVSLSKTVIMKVGRSHPSIDFLFGTLALPVVDQFRDLGLYYTKSLSYAPHINFIVSKAKARCCYIFRAFRTRDFKLLSKLFTIYVLPLLSYYSAIWSPFKASEIRLVESVQRQFTRWAFRRAGLASSPYSRRCLVMGLTPLHTLRLAADLKLLFTIVRGFSIASFENILERNQNRHCTRGHPFRLLSPRIYSNTFKNSFPVRILPLWNSLPSHLVLLPSPHSFSQQILPYLLANNISCYE